jgi:peptide/nickel transport system substrate-binding protein
MRCLFSRANNLAIGYIGLALMLLVSVACGSAAQPADQPAADSPAVQSIAPPTAAAQPAAPPSEVTVHPGKVTVMVGDFRAERFDYAFNSSPEYQRLLHGLLIATNESNEKIPGIASDWNISADGLTWTFTIREGVKFHDGTEVTMEDVLWTWQHYYDPRSVANITGKILQDVARITGKIELTGPNQISHTTQVPYAGLEENVSELGTATVAIMPKRGELWDKGLEAAYDKNPIATGPMRLVNHFPAVKMEFERFNDYYYQPKYGLPEDRRVKFTFLDLFLVPEEATRVAAIRAGEADIAPVSLASRAQVEAGGARLQFVEQASFFYVWQLGCWDPQLLPPCRDKRVRHALAYALDKELIRDRLYGPEVMVLKGWEPVTPGTIGYSPELDPFPYNPDKARQLLAEAGYPGGQGFGKLVVNTWVTPATPLMPESAQVAADMWRKELGLDVEVKVGDRTAMTKLRQDGQFAGQIVWSSGAVQPDASRWVRSMYGTPGRVDRLHIDDDLFDMVARATGTFDPEERPKAMNELFLRLRDEQYAIGIGYLNIPWAVGPRIETWRPWPLSDHTTAVHTITLK